MYVFVFFDYVHQVQKNSPKLLETNFGKVNNELKMQKEDSLKHKIIVMLYSQITKLCKTEIFDIKKINCSFHTVKRYEIDL